MRLICLTQTSAINDWARRTTNQNKLENNKSWYNLIFGKVNHENIYSSFLIGISNAITISIIIKTLVEVLDKENCDWRQKTYFMMDGASYHQGIETIKIIKDLKVPTIICSPHSP